MTGIFSASALLTAGATASESCARTMRTFAPCEIRLSMSVSCLDADDCASDEMYLAPAAARTALMAASSVFQRSSWKLFQDTPTTTWASDTLAVTARPAKASDATMSFFIGSLLQDMQTRERSTSRRRCLAGAKHQAPRRI